jgi:hypothetical protein
VDVSGSKSPPADFKNNTIERLPIMVTPPWWFFVALFFDINVDRDQFDFDVQCGGSSIEPST